ncbi:MAG: subclass B3 metallo-beta-lactamase [Vicinamibacteria bacterium]
MKTLVAAIVLAAAAATAGAQDNEEWSRPTEPFRVVGTVHYVGTVELGAYLITTSAGHILIDGGLPSSAAPIEASIRKLGLDPKEIRILLTTQAHFDHVGSMAYFKKLSGARVEVMDGDVPALESGGKKDYLFGPDEKFHFEPVKVDRVLKDGDSVTLGGATLKAVRTPGHTPGSTTWTMTADEKGTKYQVVFAASAGINPGTRLVTDPSYPGIVEDYAYTLKTLAAMKPDIFLGSHTGFFKMEEKRTALFMKKTPHPFVDAEGWRTYVASRQKGFDDYVAKEKAEAGKPKP